MIPTIFLPGQRLASGPLPARGVTAYRYGARL